MMVYQDPPSPSAQLSPLRDPESRTDLVVEAIRSAILVGEIRPGEALVERDLARILGVSKTPVREALKVLSRSGLVHLSAYRGASVRQVDAKLVRSVYELRWLLEPEALRRSMGGNQASVDLEGARQLLAQAARAISEGDRADLGLVNRQFHRCLYGSYENDLLVAHLDDLQDLTALISVVGWRLRSTWQDELTEHAEVVAALEANEIDLAADLLGQHISAFATSTVSALSEGDKSSPVAELGTSP